YQPIASDWRNYEAWQQDGGVWTAERAHRIFKDIMADFKAPAIDEGDHEALKDFIARRKSEGGVPTDF
ncbi:MAG: trimethylamine methyltransferase family protein, partial [Paracoccaceae bacterium]